jgi:hypothetical protein
MNVSDDQPRIGLVAPWLVMRSHECGQPREDRHDRGNE